MSEQKRIRMRYGTLANNCAGTVAHLVYTQDELNSLRYYKGVIEQIVLREDKANLQDFYRISNAYEALNMLLYPGVSNEQVRIVDEQRKIYPEMLDNMWEILKIYENLATAIYKYTYSHHWRIPIQARRFDREASLDILKQGQSCAFMSTTLAPDLNYFHKKKGLVLEEVDAPAMVECLDVNEVLGNQNRLSEEEEILFPPFLKLTLEEDELNEQEQAYQDRDGKPPVGKYLIHITGSEIEGISVLNATRCDEKVEELKAQILKDEAILNAKTVWGMLSSGQALEEKQEKMYAEWKRAVQAYVKLIFCKAKGCITQKETLLKKGTLFQEELNCALETNNLYRKRYGQYVEITGIIMSVCSALVTFFLALSFADHEIFALVVKVIGLLLSCFSLITSGVCKSKVWEGKLKQRTYTYLKLDELQRDFRYEETLEDETLEKYVQRFKEILYADNTYCEKNTELAIDHLDTLHDNQPSK